MIRHGTNCEIYLNTYTQKSKLNKKSGTNDFSSNNEHIAKYYEIISLNADYIPWYLVLLVALALKRESNLRSAQRNDCKKNETTRKQENVKGIHNL